MRMNLLNKINDNQKKIVICPINSYFKKLPSPNYFKDLRIKIKKDDIYERDKLIKRLLEIGYKKDVIVTNTGEFSVRGFVLDVFIINQEHPIRIEFFDDKIEKIKYFDEFTQLSINETNEIIIEPIIDEYEGAKSNILDYLDESITIIQDYNKIEKVVDTINEQAKYYDDNNTYQFLPKEIDTRKENS